MDPTVPRMSAVPPPDDTTLKVYSMRHDEPDDGDAQWHAFNPQAVRVSMPQRPADGIRVLVAVVAIAVLVVATAGFALIRTHTSQGRHHQTPVVAATATPIVPTATPVPAPLTPDQAWTGGSILHIPLTVATGEVFTPTDVFPDGTALVGFLASAPGAPITIATLAIPSRAVRQLYSPSSDITAATVTTDGRFVAYLATAQGTGSLHQVIGYYDLQTSARYSLVDTFQQARLPGARIIGHNDLLWASTSSYRLTDMATFAFADVSITPATVSGAVLGSWPYLFYVATDKTPHLYNLQTSTDTALTQLESLGSGGAVAVSGDQVFWAHAASDGSGLTIDAAAHAGQPGASLANVVTISGAGVPSQLIVSSRFFVLVGSQNAVWDRVAQHLVLLPASVTGIGSSPNVNGSILWYATVGASGPEADIVDATQLPG